MKFRFLILVFLVTLQGAGQQQLKPGFDPNEYAALLSLTFNGSSIGDSNKRKVEKDPYTRLYRSPESGLMNRWQFFLRNDGVGVIEIRGTINQVPSWMENFYAAMIPAAGSLQLNDSTLFPYKFAENPRAMVHVGWAVGVGLMGPDIIEKINFYFREKKITDYFITGHSQGGALSQLMRSYLEYQQKEGKIPAGIHFKTYASAAPKTGNLYYAYDYDFITRDGWAYTIVNSADWVPEVPFSIQTLEDFNATNPFTDVKPILKKQKLLVRVAGKMIYNKMDRSTRKAQKRMNKYLGKMVYKQVKKYLPQLKEPVYAKGNNYMRAGNPIILMADADYYLLYPDGGPNKFVHHMFQSYYYLLRKYYAVP